MVKEEIARYDQFLLLQYCFQKTCRHVNPFPHDNILEQTKIKAFADEKLNVTKMIISVFDRVENIVGK